MKLYFEPNLDYQLQAIEAVCDLFRGQEICRTEFTVTRDPLDPQSRLFEMNDHGIGNRLTLLDDEIVKNLGDIQLRNGLQPSEALASGDFTVEMETGTGKTYVYLRSIFELNKRYGFTKFVIVVPSVAIKEGVYHSIEIAEEHLKGLYAGVPFDYFLVISAKIEVDAESAGGVKRREVTVQDGDNLEQTTGRAIYADCRIDTIRVERGNEYMELRVPGGEQFLKPGESWGDVDAMAVQREMIRRAIREHLDKEKRLGPTEQAKIVCGREHFKALQVREAPARYIVASSVEEVLAQTR